MKHKKLLYIIFVFAVVLSLNFFSSCGKQEEKDPVKRFQASLTQEDTTSVLTMCDAAMNLLREKRYDEFLSMVYDYDFDSGDLSPLTEDMKVRHSGKFRMFPVVSYERDYYSFLLEYCNDVKYNVVFASAEETGNGLPAKTSFMFNPVKRDGKWYLCLKTSKDLMDRRQFNGQ